MLYWGFEPFFTNLRGLLARLASSFAQWSTILSAQLGRHILDAGSYAAYQRHVRARAFRSTSIEIRRALFDERPIGPARALRRAGYNRVDLFGIQGAMDHQRLGDRQDRRALRRGGPG